MLAKRSSSFSCCTPGNGNQGLQLLPAAGLGQYQFAQLGLSKSCMHLSLRQRPRRAQRHDQNLGFSRIRHHFEIEATQFSLKKQTPQTTGQYWAQGMGKGLKFRLLHPSSTLQRQPNQKLGPALTGPQRRKLLALMAHQFLHCKVQQRSLQIVVGPGFHHCANRTTIHLSYQQIRSTPAMDCTTQLGMLRERRQRGQALLAGQRLVLCSQSWPLLVSQSTALQGGADVVAACTTENEARKHVQQRKPQLLITHDQLQQGCGISLVSHCKQIQPLSLIHI